MMRELTAEDFARAARNPHFDKLMIKIEVPVVREDWDLICKLVEFNDVRPEIILQRCIADFADDLREDDF